ncbi:MAG: glycosyltransferase [Acidobacteriota bacterium]|nr:glycosyltransferase [Acidobacteriota bacterium]
MGKRLGEASLRYDTGLFPSMPTAWVVVPCYNEEARLPVAAIDAFLRSHADIHICLVDDGSRDGTRRVLDAIAAGFPAQVTVLACRGNQGKAEAVRLGVLHGLHGLPHSQATMFGYWDADLSTPLGEIDLLVRTMDARADGIAAMGCRVKRLGADIKRSAVRHYLGRVFATFASITLRLAVHDSQCGAKLFRREAAAIAFKDPFESQWLFDVEILARLRNHFSAERVRQNVIEVPLQVWTHLDGSKLRARHYVLAPLELWRIARRYNRRAKPAGGSPAA